MKANGLKPYEYFKYLLEKLVEIDGEISEELIRPLVPWSDELPDYVRAGKNK